MASLVLSTRLAKGQFSYESSWGHVCGSRREKCLAPASKFYDGPDPLMTLSVIIAFLSILQVWQFQHYCVAFVK